MPNRLHIGKKADDWENRERSESLRQDRCCKAEPRSYPLIARLRRGQGDEAESEDLPVESIINSSD